MTLGSLFDGAGGFPFAAQICGIEPVWASEIEPFPVKVTSKRFPNMKHLGDITKINGAEIEPVDMITFGSPCQDLSVAGRQAGLAGERSGLFMEAVRIIKEMRGKTNGRKPTVAVWENVPGAFSSNKGEDFRVVIEELCKVKDGGAVIPRPPKGKWADAGEIVGDGYSVAWRVLDAQFWGVPQRRRRIFLVADFGGECAGKILFEREGLSRNFAESLGSREAAPGSSEDRSGTSGVACVRERCGCEGGGKGLLIQNDASNTIQTNNDRFVVVYRKTARPKAKGESPTYKQSNIANTLNTFDVGEARANEVVIMATQPCYALDRSAYNQGQNAKFDMGIDEEGTAYTVVAKGPGAVCYAIGNGQVDQTRLSDIPGALNCMHDQQAVLVMCGNIIVRRLTPTECARLQGMPDWWCDDVPHADSAEYKMWGNGMALPCVLYVMEGVTNLLKERKNDET